MPKTSKLLKIATLEPFWWWQAVWACIFPRPNTISGLKSSRSEPLKLRLELYCLCFLVLIQILVGFKNRAHLRYLRACIRGVIFWRWFVHNLVVGYWLLA